MPSVMPDAAACAASRWKAATALARPAGDGISMYLVMALEMTPPTRSAPMSRATAMTSCSSRSPRAEIAGSALEMSASRDSPSEQRTPRSCRSSDRTMAATGITAGSKTGSSMRS